MESRIYTIWQTIENGTVTLDAARSVPGETTGPGQTILERIASFSSELALLEYLEGMKVAA